MIADLVKLICITPSDTIRASLLELKIKPQIEGLWRPYLRFSRRQTANNTRPYLG